MTSRTRVSPTPTNPTGTGSNSPGPTTRTYRHSNTASCAPSPPASDGAPTCTPRDIAFRQLTSGPSKLPDQRRRNRMDDELLTADEVAARLRATPRFVRRLVAERRIEYVKVGRLVRFEPSAVATYIDN